MSEELNTWGEALKDEFEKPYFKQLYNFVMMEYQKETPIYPPKSDILNALRSTPLDKVKVVILGQDPYHNAGQAHGLSFSVNKGVAIPPSLLNIYKELRDDLGCYIPNNGDLTKWARQGILLLNAILTVRAHQPLSHKGIGWETFTDSIIEILNKSDRPICFMLWGASAKCPCLPIRIIWYLQLLIQVLCHHTEASLDVSIFQRQMNSLLSMVKSQLTGR